MKFEMCSKQDIPKSKRMKNSGKYDRLVEKIIQSGAECAKIQGNSQSVKTIGNGIYKALQRTGNGMYHSAVRGTCVYVYRGEL